MTPVLVAFLLCIDTGGDGWVKGGSEVHVNREAIVAVLETLPPGPCALVVTTNRSKFAVYGTVAEILQQIGSSGD